MGREYPKIDPALHQKILQEEILRDPDFFLNATSADRPRAIITAGQPGAGKSKVVGRSEADLDGNVVTVDPDELRKLHPQVDNLRQQHPYTWSGHTHGDASQWATELREAAMAQRKNIILDTTMPRADLIKELQAQGYDVEIRAIATHRLESELGVDNRFSRDLDRFGQGRHVPEEVRKSVYNKLPGALDDVAKQTGVPIQIYDREGRLHFDSRTTPNASPGRALEAARFGRLTQDRLNDLHQSTGAQRQWHRDLPGRVPNERVSPDTARHLLDERQTGRVEEGVQRLHNEVGGYRAVRPTIKAAGVLGTAYGAYDAKGQVDAAIDTARSTREQWVRGAEESANQATKTVVTGAAATVGAIPGATAGALTSPVTGPVGPVLGGLATGGAAAYGAEKLYEESRLQQFSKYLGRQAGDLGYDYLSREGRLLRQVNGLRQDLGEAQDPAERARLQGRLDQASAAFQQEAERNNRYFEGREKVDQVWEKMHARIPRVDKDDVQAALARHIDAGKRPGDAVRGAFSDAVHARYPRTLDHEPLENYRALSNTQLTDRYRQYQGEVVQDERTVQALRANTQSHNDLDQGWPKALAERRQAERLETALNEQWRDRGHLKAIGEAMRERGMSPPVTLSPAQQRYHQQAQEQIEPGLRRMGVGDEQIDRVTAAAVSHAQSRAQGAPVQAFHLSKDGQRVAMIGPTGLLSEFRVSEAMSQPADQHLAQARAHADAHEKVQAKAHANVHANEPSHRPDPSQSQTPAAPPVHEPPVMAR